MKGVPSVRLFESMPDHLRALAQAGAEGPEFFRESVFPSGTVHELIRYFDSGALVSLQELPLGEYLTADELVVYRFLWTRTFHPAVTIRVSEFVNGRGTVCSKMAAGMAGFEIGPIVRQIERTVGRWRLGRLRQIISKQGFWEAPPTDEHDCLDGAGWLFEAVSPEGYHVVRRHSSDSDVVHSLGKQMIRLSGLRIKSRDVY